MTALTKHANAQCLVSQEPRVVWVRCAACRHNPNVVTMAQTVENAHAFRAADLHSHFAEQLHTELDTEWTLGGRPAAILQSVHTKTAHQRAYRPQLVILEPLSIATPSRCG